MRWTATVSGTASKTADLNTIRHHPEGWTYENMIYLIKMLEDNYPEPGFWRCE